MKTIAIDFDGVIHKYGLGWSDGTIYDVPVDGAFLAIEKLLKEYTVYVHTTRDPKAVHLWFLKQKTWTKAVERIPEGVEFWNKKDVLGITNRKLPAIAYIDDRGIRFTDWTDILNYF